jgi:hypothetical protein
MAMQKSSTKKYRNYFIFIFILIITLSSACSSDTPKESKKTSSTNGFTFFDLGSNSPLSDHVRNNLEDRLGSEAIEHRSTIDLSIHYSDFLKTYFPHLDELNNELNWPPRERVEHNITKLMYRYAPLPFTYVELYFSDDTGEPLFFRIHASAKGASLLEALKKKYGTPKEIKWPKTDEFTLYWQKQNGILTVSKAQNRFEKPEYLFCIYYVKNIEKLIKTENIRRKAKEEKIKNAGKTAF